MFWIKLEIFNNLLFMRVQMSKPFFLDFFVLSLLNILPILFLDKLNQVFTQIVKAVLDGVKYLIENLFHFLAF